MRVKALPGQSLKHISTVLNSVKKVKRSKFQHVLTHQKSTFKTSIKKYYLFKYFMFTSGLSTIWWVIVSSDSSNVAPTYNVLSNDTSPPKHLCKSIIQLA